MASISIDSGSACTKAATFDAKSRKPTMITLGGERRDVVPSSVYVPREGPVLAGQAARESIAKDPAGTVDGRKVKWKIHESKAILIQDRRIDRVELAASILENIREQASRQAFPAGAITECCLAVPLKFDLQQKDCLTRAASVAGFKTIRLMEEPVAAAGYLISQSGLSPKSLAVCDIGEAGVRLDLLRLAGSNYQSHPAVQSGGFDIAGADVDEKLWEAVENALSAAQTDLKSRPLSQSEALALKNSVMWACESVLWGDTFGKPAALGPLTLPVLLDIARRHHGRFIERLIDELRRFAAALKKAGIADIPLLLVGGGIFVGGLEEAVRRDGWTAPVYRPANAQYAAVLGAAPIVTAQNAPVSENKKDRKTPMTKKNHEALDFLKQLFKDRPDLINVLTLGDLETRELLDRLQRDEGFSEPVNLYLTGRTHAGKTTLSGKFLGREVMPITGMMDSTYSVCYGKLKSNLRYFDLPGISSRTKYENINRVAVNLNQIEDDGPEELVQAFPFDDFTDAHLEGGNVVGLRKETITVDQWHSPKSRQFAPDVILAVVAPHALFDRLDSQYFRTLFAKHGDRVVVVLNLWHSADGERTASDKLIQQIRGKISDAFARACPNAKSPVPILEVDAKTGASVPQLVEQICRLVPPLKMGRMQRVLQDDLKKYADNQRALNHQRTVHRIAARLAFYDVNEKRNRRDILFEAAQSLVAYTLLTFDYGDRLVEAQEAIAESLNQGVDSVRSALASDWENITETTETTRIVKEQFTRKVVDHVARGFGERVGGFFSNLLDFNLSGALDELTSSHREVTREVEDFIEVPVTDTHTTIVGRRNTTTGREVRNGSEPPLRGGLSGIAFLLGYSLGARGLPQLRAGPPKNGRCHDWHCSRTAYPAQGDN